MTVKKQKTRVRAKSHKAESREHALIMLPLDMLVALKECQRLLGIREDFVPFGIAMTLAPILDAAIHKCWKVAS
jgi:hypothetical protein